VFAAVEGIGRVAITAAKRASGQANEDRRIAAMPGLALQGVKDLGNRERLVGPVRQAGGWRIDTRRQG